ncbi:MAG: hypothetical protein U0324_24200 [Polyangiales bacterium]
MLRRLPRARRRPKVYDGCDMDDKIRRMVGELNRQGVKSEYLDRLTERVNSLGNAELSMAALEVELRQEVSQSLGRAEDRINHALLALELAGRKADAAPPGAAREALVADFNALRAEALRRREYLLIQREALGFRGNDALERLYPVPRAR